MQILSDGEKLAILMDDHAYCFENYYLTNFNISFEQDIIELPLDYSRESGYKEYVRGFSSTNIDLSIRSGGKVLSKETKDLLLDFNIFNDMTVRELFKVIQNKIKERSK